MAVLEEREPFDETLEPELDTTSFGEFGLARALLKAIRRAGYEQPRPIQEQTLPAAMEGRDILGLAQTGTGKTAAFVLPILHRFVKEPRRAHRCLILAPTRELAIQIETEVHALAHYTQIGAVSIYGGVSERPQLNRLSKGPEVIVACPGRLLDLMRQKLIDLSTIQVLVLDEADHMFDMGFLEDVRKIIRALPERRQNLLFAATMPKEIRELARVILDRPYEVELAHTTPAETIDHALYPVIEERKFDLLEHFISAEDFKSGIIFTRTKFRAKRIAIKLGRMGHKAVALQGNMSQSQRDRAMQGFRKGDYDVLVATDIVARGIDVEQVSHVINFDVPNTAEAYTHRIGRTGRSQREGKAYTFVTDEDGEIIRAIERKIGERLEISDELILPDMILPTPGSRRRSKKSRDGGSRGRSRGGEFDREERPPRGGRGGGSRERSRSEESGDRRPRRQRSAEGSGADRERARGEDARGSDGANRPAKKRRSRRGRRAEGEPRPTDATRSESRGDDATGNRRRRRRRPDSDGNRPERGDGGGSGSRASENRPADGQGENSSRESRGGRSQREPGEGNRPRRSKNSRGGSRGKSGSRGERGARGPARTPDGLELEIEPKKRRPPPMRDEGRSDASIPDGVDFEP